MKISLICATYNRSTELEQLLKSLVAQSYKNFEIIIVDQNKNGLINHICQSYKQHLDLIHIKSDKLGSSTNRNLGIKAATGEILGFPDDDCTYYPDTLANVILTFNSSYADLIYGKIFDKANNRDLIRKWPKQSQQISSLYQIMLYSWTFVIFFKNKFYFDEDFGINQNFGALEEIDFCYRYKLWNKTLFYDPKITVKHPESISNFLNPQKAYNYGCGWGAFVAKHVNLKTSFLFIGIFSYVFLLMLRDIVLQKPFIKGRFFSILGRINGFYNYLLKYRLKNKCKS